MAEENSCTLLAIPRQQLSKLF